MTLLIACLLIYGLGLPGWLYVLSTGLWATQVWYLYRVVLRDLVEELARA